MPTAHPEELILGRTVRRRLSSRTALVSRVGALHAPLGAVVVDEPLLRRLTQRRAGAALEEACRRGATRVRAHIARTPVGAAAPTRPFPRHSRMPGSSPRCLARSTPQRSNRWYLGLRPHRRSATIRGATAQLMVSRAARTSAGDDPAPLCLRRAHAGDLPTNRVHNDIFDARPDVHPSASRHAAPLHVRT